MQKKNNKTVQKYTTSRQKLLVYYKNKGVFRLKYDHKHYIRGSRPNIME